MPEKGIVLGFSTSSRPLEVVWFLPGWVFDPGCLSRNKSFYDLNFEASGEDCQQYHTRLSLYPPVFEHLSHTLLFTELDLCECSESEGSKPFLIFIVAYTYKSPSQLLFSIHFAGSFYWTFEISRVHSTSRLNRLCVDMSAETDSSKCCEITRALKISQQVCDHLRGLRQNNQQNTLLLKVGALSCRKFRRDTQVTTMPFLISLPLSFAFTSKAHLRINESIVCRTNSY